jgi:hypothetical protein
VSNSLTLPFAGAVSVTGIGFEITNTTNTPFAFGTVAAVVGNCTNAAAAVGVLGRVAANNAAGIMGVSDGAGDGANGNSVSGVGVRGLSQTSHGVVGQNGGPSGFVPDRGIGVWGDSVNGVGVLGTSKFIGIIGQGAFLAARFVGDVQVTGDLCLVNQDCAEDFEISCTEEVEPGMVMVIEQDGALHVCSSAYDKRVAGVISGAGSFRPGIILGRQQPDDKRMPVALLGKTWCKVDASFSSINVGDLLTTSVTCGYAMKASDPERSFGAVIGKALGQLESGKGLIPILIALQ